MDGWLDGSISCVYVHLYLCVYCMHISIQRSLDYTKEKAYLGLNYEV